MANLCDTGVVLNERSDLGNIILDVTHIYRVYFEYCRRRVGPKVTCVKDVIRRFFGRLRRCLRTKLSGDVNIIVASVAKRSATIVPAIDHHSPSWATN